MFKKKNKAKRKLILCMTGRKIYAVLRNRQRVLARNDFPAETELKDILNWGQKQNADSFRVLGLSELYDLAVDWNEELEFEENIEALNYELSSLSGQSSELTRPAMIPENSIRDCKHGVICAGFKSEDIKDMAGKGGGVKLAFKGIGSIQQALLIDHFTNPERRNEVLLFFMYGGAFAAFMENGRIVIRNMPFGLPDGSTSPEQWKTRAERRLSSFKGREICLYLEEKIEGFQEQLAAVIVPEKIRECSLSEVIPELSGIVFSGEANSMGFFSLAGIPPRVKDPREAGTMICLVLIGGTIVLLLFQFLKLKISENALEDTLKQKKDMQQTIKTHESQIEKSKEQLLKFQKLYRIIKSRKHIDPDFIRLINLLGRYKLKYTKINRIQEQSNGVVISGETYWQPDLSKFFAHFERQLTLREMSLMPEGLEKIDDTRLAFKCRISKR
jgi:hypothetical protein